MRKCESVDAQRQSSLGRPFNCGKRHPTVAQRMCALSTGRRGRKTRVIAPDRLNERCAFECLHIAVFVEDGFLYAGRNARGRPIHLLTMQRFGKQLAMCA